MSIRTITYKQYKGVMSCIVNRMLKLQVTTLPIDTGMANRLKKEVIRMYLYKKMEIFFIVMLVTLLTGCGGGSAGSSSAGSSSGASSIQAVETALASKAVQQGQITDSVTGEPLANVEVNIGSHTTTTDEQGFYELKDITASDNAVITFKHESYYLNSEIIAIKEYSNGTTLSPNYLEFSLDKYDTQHNDDSQNEKIWNTNFGIEIPGGIYTDDEGNDYSGNVIAKVAYEDVSTEKGRDVFPGAYEGKNTNDVIVPFVSYGFMVIDLKDESDTALSISGDIVLTFHTATGATEDIIPLWYYDYAQGIWIEEGYATRLSDGKYEGTVSHPGTWSLSQPVEDASSIYTDRILYPDGTPVTNLRVHAVGNNWIRTDLSTDENGVFEIEVIPGEDFSLKAYHYEDKYGAESATIQAVAPGDITNKIN